MTNREILREGKRQLDALDPASRRIVERAGGKQKVAEHPPLLWASVAHARRQQWLCVLGIVAFVVLGFGPAVSGRPPSGWANAISSNGVNFMSFFALLYAITLVQYRVTEVRNRRRLRLLLDATVPIEPPLAPAGG